MSSKTDFEMFAGDTREIIVAVVDQDGIVVDLTGGQVLWRVAVTSWQKDPTVTLIEKNSANAGEITLANGQFTVHLLSPDTVGMDGNFYHEAQVTLGDGTIGTPLTGKLKVKPNLIEPR